MTQYIQQAAGSIDITINRGDSWTCNVDVDKDLTLYTVTAWIKYGSNTIVLTVTPISLALGQFTVSLSATNSALITIQDNEIFVKWVYGEESRTIINGTFRVIQ